MPHVIPRSEGRLRKVVVVGAGPAGLEAARVAAARGHRVVLLEAAPSPGGQLRLAAALARRREIVAIAGWLQAEIERLDWTEVHLKERFIEVKASKSKTASCASASASSFSRTPRRSRRSSSASTAASVVSSDTTISTGNDRLLAPLCNVPSLGVGASYTCTFSSETITEGAGEETHAAQPFLQRRLEQLEITEDEKRQRSEIIQIAGLVDQVFSAPPTAPEPSPVDPAAGNTLQQQDD